jgi:tRNA G18 (ribose-2'-O)-methylase SpoU
MLDNTQLTHADHKPSSKKFPLSIIANDIINPVNVGSLFRLCDALGIEKIYLCGDTPAPPNTKINKTSRSTEKYVDYESGLNAEILVAQLKASGSFIISLEITSSSLAISSDEFAKKISNKTPVCLILGAENAGVSESLLSLSDITMHIPMHGNNSSMNVISAASIASFEIIRCI